MMKDVTEKRNKLGWRECPKTNPATPSMKKRALLKIPVKMRSSFEQRVQEAATIGELLDLISFTSNLKEATIAAQDLFYDELCLQQLKKAQSIGEIERIMIDARHRAFRY